MSDPARVIGQGDDCRMTQPVTGRDQHVFGLIVKRDLTVVNMKMEGGERAWEKRERRVVGKGGRDREK